MKTNYIVVQYVLNWPKGIKVNMSPTEPVVPLRNLMFHAVPCVTDINMEEFVLYLARPVIVRPWYGRGFSLTEDRKATGNVMSMVVCDRQ